MKRSRYYTTNRRNLNQNNFPTLICNRLSREWIIFFLMSLLVLWLSSSRPNATNTGRNSQLQVSILELKNVSLTENNRTGLIIYAPRNSRAASNILRNEKNQPRCTNPITNNGSSKLNSSLGIQFLFASYEKKILKWRWKLEHFSHFSCISWTIKMSNWLWKISRKYYYDF